MAGGRAIVGTAPSGDASAPADIVAGTAGLTARALEGVARALGVPCVTTDAAAPTIATACCLQTLDIIALPASVQPGEPLVAVVAVTQPRTDDAAELDTEFLFALQVNDRGPFHAANAMFDHVRRGNVAPVAEWLRHRRHAAVARSKSCGNTDGGSDATQLAAALVGDAAAMHSSVRRLETMLAHSGTLRSYARERAAVLLSHS
jgi:hypothetical protein